MSNNNLTKAKAAKDDEFYTRLIDIENELKFYKAFFKNKTILMPCDDPELFSEFEGDLAEDTASQFWVYFHKNFSYFGLKEIIATHFTDNGTAYKINYTGGDDNNILCLEKENLKGSGDFNSPEIKNIISKADLIITNPPFSLFRQFIKLLLEMKKNFIVIGPEGAITYKDFFPLIKNNKVWPGYTKVKKFIYVDAEKNVQYRTFGNIGWWTNVKTKKRAEEIILFKKFKEDEYPKFDNYKAINIDRINDIPEDYFEPMGVPISFVNKYNPAQFRILDGNDIREEHMRIKAGQMLIKDKDGVVNGKAKYARIVIERIENNGHRTKKSQS